jgi:chromosome segregation ATPase
LVQDVIDINIPPESLNLDAQHTELQLHHAMLQQEYQTFLIQHETLVSKSDTQHEKINYIENENAKIKGLLEQYTGEHQRLNDAYHRAIQEHEACQKVKEHLQDLAYRWKAQSEENMELNSTCTKLRQELKKALENRMPDKPFPRVDEVQAPVAVEATTMSDMEYSDDESSSHDMIPYTWKAGSNNQYQYEIFLVYAITGVCELQGYSFDISRSIKEAVP